MAQIIASLGERVKSDSFHDWQAATPDRPPFLGRARNGTSRFRHARPDMLLFPCGYFFEPTYNCAQRRSICSEKFNIFLQFPK